MYIDIGVNVNFFLLVLNQKLNDECITDVYDTFVHRRDWQFIIYKAPLHITPSAEKTLSI